MQAPAKARFSQIIGLQCLQRPVGFVSSCSQLSDLVVRQLRNLFVDPSTRRPAKLCGKICD